MDILKASLTPEEFADFEIAYREDKARWHRTYDSGDFMIRTAIRIDSPKIVRILFEAGIRLTLVDDDNVLFEVKSGEVLQLLLAQGVPIEPTDENETPLFFYVSRNYVSAVNVAIGAGMDPDHEGDYGRPLHEAKSIEVAKILLDHGVSRTANDHMGRTPSANAIFHERYDLAEYIDNYEDLPIKGVILE